MPTKIFVFCNSGPSDRRAGWYSGMAIAEDGRYITGHVSSSRSYFRADMGLVEGTFYERRHAEYAAACPEGYELVEVAEGDELAHEGLRAAYAKNQERAEAVIERAADRGAP